MQFIFTRSHTLDSFVVRVFTWSRWSHVGVIVNGMVIDAMPKSGVRHLSLKKVIAQSSDYEIISVDVPNEKEIIEFGLAQVGKPYDWSAIFSIVFSRDWHEEDKWICSELWAAAFEKFGIKAFPTSAQRVTPEDWYKYVKNLRSA